MFVVYDVIYRRKAAFGYSLLVKLGVWTTTETLITKLTSSQLVVAAKEISEINKCTDPAILALEQQVQTAAAHAPHSYAQCFQFRPKLKALMITDRMPALWVIINLSDLQCLLVIRLAGIQLDPGKDIMSAFTRKTATMNPVAMAKFFHVICNAVFKSLLAARHQERGLFGPITTYFATVETNGRGMLHLHCLLWLAGLSHLATL